MLARITCAALAALVVIMGVSAASADESGEQARIEQARVHYQAGLQAYNIGEFDEAIAEWTAAYKLYARPDFLFNIAQAHRSKRDHARAIFFINAYLRESPDAPNREEVTALRDELQRLLDEQRARAAATAPRTTAADAAPGGATPPHGIDPGQGAVDETAGRETGARATSQVPAAVTPHDNPGGRSLTITGVAVGATGIALVGTGIAFGLAASSAQSDLEEAAMRGDPWTPALVDRESAGARNATIGKVLGIAGGAALVAGGVLVYLGLDGAASGGSVAIAPSIGTVNGAVVVGAF